MALQPTESGEAPGADSSRLSRLDRLLAVAGAGLIGSALAVAVSLPLQSPDDLLANAFTVAAVSVPGAFVLAAVWSGLSGDATLGRRTRWFAAVNAGFLVATMVAALAAEALGDVSSVTSFAAPLALTVLGSAAVATPILAHYGAGVSPSVWRYGVPIAAATILVVAWLLTVNEVGFNEPPSLSLPPPP